jgi:hypothetical protein
MNAGPLIERPGVSFAQVEILSREQSIDSISSGSGHLLSASV